MTSSSQPRGSTPACTRFNSPRAERRIHLRRATNGAKLPTRMSGRVPSKKQTLLQYLQRGVAMVHLDARRPGVVVPPQYARDAHLRLNLSYRYSIPDLEVFDDRIQATLSFGGRPFRCILP